MAEPAPADIRAALQSIVSSRAFAHAERLRRFLAFVVEETLAGRAGELKEYSVGRSVCGRGEPFDPKADPIVRVDASRLRSRLETYYAAEGAQDRVRISLPKGTYVPVFEAAPPPVASSTGTAPSLAVLPFVNLGTDSEKDYLGESLAEELIHSLTKLGAIRVIGRSSAFRFKNGPLDAVQAGAELKVQYVLEGSVRMTERRMRVTAQLVDVAGGWLLWSERYECDWKDVLGIEDEIAASITDALSVRLIGERARALFQHETTSAEAYEHYLKGRYFANQRTYESLHKSIQSFEQALELDPNYPLPYCGLADSYLVQAFNDHAPALECMPKARAAALKALELKKELPEALVSLGCIRSAYEWDWEAGEGDFRRAIRLSPGSPAGHHMYALVNLLPRAKWREALEEMESAIHLDPASPLLRRDLGLIHFFRRDYERALAEFRLAEELDPSFIGVHFWLGRAFVESGRCEEGLAALTERIAAGSANTRVLGAMACAYARLGDRDRAIALMEHLLELSGTEPVPPQNLAIISAALGWTDRAFECLAQAAAERAPALTQFGVEPAYDALRGDRRAVELLRALRLA